MYRKVDDFLQDWQDASSETLRVLEAMTDEKLDQAIIEGHNTLRWLGWHLATAPAYFAGLLGLELSNAGDAGKLPSTAKEIAEGYQSVSKELAEKVSKEFSDKHLTEKVDQHGRPTAGGAILRTLIDHQTHHRGQITVLLRQAGLNVPGVMGPTKEDLEK
ncbi:DinB family protein [Oceanobacillus alkalisoli]|uniref:DinB family protein n=1 Tax=Oceanobacillus alkalisoli TaxID=2925113 RepID=UPI001EF0626D|nr:DinB family protein [Oceanobacillus alkalisoli]MCF3941941.1 DinB family protein [Oceanobacillus alkalisoli]MCG5104316.1 DinB family protein [Oceanobacillus alkalisoli]